MKRKFGGKQPGAGRPKGSTTRVKVLDYFTDKELKDFWADLKERAKTDAKIALYFAEQMTGKATQPNSFEDKDGNDIPISILGGVVKID